MKRLFLAILVVTGGLSLAGWSLSAFFLWTPDYHKVFENESSVRACVIVLCGLLFLIEWFLLKSMDMKPGPIFFLSWIPFLFAWPMTWMMSGMTLPAPHDYLPRKMEIAMGAVWVSHLFLFALLLVRALWKGRVQRPARAVTLLALFLFPALLMTTTWCDVTGDEPHYLLMAHSILHDHDLDLANNYVVNDAAAFHGRGTLEPQGLEHVVEGRRYSHHPIGSVLFILPGYALLGRYGAALMMAIAAALALGGTLKVLKNGGAGPDTLLATGAAGLLASRYFFSRGSSSRRSRPRFFLFFS